MYLEVLFDRKHWKIFIAESGNVYQQTRKQLVLNIFICFSICVLVLYVCKINNKGLVLIVVELSVLSSFDSEDETRNNKQINHSIFYRLESKEHLYTVSVKGRICTRVKNICIYAQKKKTPPTTCKFIHT